MDLSHEPSQDEARILERPLYRPGQTPPAAKPPAASRPSSPASLPTVKRSSPATGAKPSRVKHFLAIVLLGGFGYYLLYGTPQTRKRILKVLGAALWLFLLGSVSYCLFLPDPVAEIKDAFAEMRNLPPEKRREKFREIRSLMRELTPQQRYELGKDRRKKEYEQLSSFMKLSPEEQYEKTKKQLLAEKARRDQRAANGGRRGNPNRGGQGGANAGGRNGGGGPGGAGRGGAAGGGAPAGGGPGGGRAGRGGAGPGAGGFGGGGRGRDPDARNKRQKDRLDWSDPESRAMKSYSRGLNQQIRQQLGLPAGGPGGFGGRGGPPGGFGGPGGRR